MRIKHRVINITEHFYQLGTPSFPVYLSLGDSGMIIEGGTGATFTIIIDQIKSIGINPERIKYLTLTHTHADHIGAIPHLKKIWTHLKIAASPLAAKLLADEKMFKEFSVVDQSIVKIMLSKGEIEKHPPEMDNYVFKIDQLLEEGDQIDLGSGIKWTVYDTPGHSPCHISLYEQKEGTLMVGDATGFYVPEKDIFWPNYFESLELYCKSIRKLAAIGGKRGALCHNGVIDSDLTKYFEKALMSTKAYHAEMLKRIGDGEDAAVIAFEKARWVNSLTDIQTFEVMRRLAKVLISRSHADAAKENLAHMPRLIT